MDINGWAVINESYVYDDESSIPYERYIDAVRAHVTELDLGFAVTVSTPNGIGMVQVAMCRNHDDRATDEILDLFRYIGQIAPGSYGQLHFRDEEGRRRDWNTMDVAVLARGSVTMHKDPFFNPCCPNIEESPFISSPKPTPSLISKFLPIGSVVVLKDGEKKLMIYGRCQKDTANDTVFDYVGCPYPEGNIGPETSFLFNHENIAWVHYLGYTGDEEDAMNARLLATSSESSHDATATTTLSPSSPAAPPTPPPADSA